MSQISSSAIIELALDLASSLNSKDRFDRLLATVRKTINCDAVALLSFHGDTLTPIALQGLSRDTMSRASKVCRALPSKATDSLFCRFNITRSL
mgnify:CR=1 FL=1